MEENYEPPSEPNTLYHSNSVDIKVSYLIPCKKPSNYIIRGGTKMLRSIKKAFDMVKQEDPDTAITVHTIRMWCKEGKIKCLTAGNKILVDVQSLMDYITIKE